ncbi:MAG: methyltransferase domain-containing protein [Myxococcales bacterium]|nr:methyltransferase domain-containing protein [Myxococcales bacterium]
MTNEISVEQLIDLSIEENILPDHKFHYRWHELAEWQFDALCRSGLEPGHRLLDIGCGPLRLGLRAIPYLEDGNYFGVEAFPPYIRLGQRVLRECGVDKRSTILQSTMFEFEKFKATFHFAIAQSVFTHMSDDQVRHCVTKLQSVMEPGGRLLFTYIVGRDPSGFLYGGVQPMVRLGVPDASWFDGLASDLGLRFECSEIPHPTQEVGLLIF